MKRLASLVVIALATSLFASAAAATVWDSYRDEFNQVKYNGSDGTLDWSSQYWQELGDGDTGINEGAVHVHPDGCGSKCLHIYGQDDDLEGAGAKRLADTSVFSWFEVCYEVRFEPYDDDSNAVLKVEKQVNGGGDWHLLAQYYLGDEPFQEHPVFSVGGPYESTTLRFTVTGTLDGEVFIDDVEIKGEPVEEPGTTTTSTSSTTSTTSTTTPSTTTSTTPSTTTSTKPAGEEDGSATSTTVPETTTTTSESSDFTDSVVIAAGEDPPGGVGGPPEGSGIRETPVGLQVAFDGGLFGSIGPFGTHFAPVDHNVDFRIIAEAIGASWVWMILLGVLIAWALVSGLDRKLERKIKRRLKTPETASD